jgi:hypothetical protein
MPFAAAHTRATTTLDADLQNDPPICTGEGISGPSGAVRRSRRTLLD